MILLAFDDKAEANIFLNRDGAKIIIDILNSYLELDEDDHDHIQYIDGLVCENQLEEYDFTNKKIATELTFRFRPDMKLKDGYKSFEDHNDTE